MRNTLPNTPSVAIVMSVFNAERYISEAIESILTQTYQTFKFYIIDDGSTDSTRSILDKCDDSRIHQVINDENKGLTTSLNDLINKLNEEVIIRMDADDIARPDRIDKILATSIDEQADWINSKISLVNENGANPVPSIESRINPNYYQNYLPYVNFFCHGSSAFTRKAFLDVGGYDSLLRYSQDYDLWLRFLAAGYKFAFIPKHLYYLRIHSKSISQDNWKEQLFFRLSASAKVKGRKIALTFITKYIFNHFNIVTARLMIIIEHIIKRYLLWASIFRKAIR